MKFRRISRRQMAASAAPGAAWRRSPSTPKGSVAALRPSRQEQAPPVVSAGVLNQQETARSEQAARRRHLRR